LGAGFPGRVSDGASGRGKRKKRSSKDLSMVSGSDDLLMGGTHGERRPLHHLATSQRFVFGSEIRSSSHSHFAYRRVVRRTALRHLRSGLCDLLMSAAAILHASFHHERPFRLPDVLRLKNLSHVACVSLIRSTLAYVSDWTSVIRGRGNFANACFQSFSIWSSITHPV
jgi:hypothetical protein